MFNIIAVKRAAFALLFVGAVAGAADAQAIIPSIPRDAPQRCKCAGGLFTLSNGTARFFVSLDDNSLEPDIFVVMRFIDQSGRVAKSQTVSLHPGASAMLERSGPGFYRAQTEAFDPATSLRLTKFRTVATSLAVNQEMLATGSGPGLLGSDIIFKYIGPGPIDPPPCKGATDVLQ